MYAIVDFICMGLLDLWWTQTEKITKWKCLPKVGFEHGTFRLRSERAKPWAIKADKYGPS